jgi:hypothetical protein
VVSISSRICEPLDANCTVSGNYLSMYDVGVQSTVLALCYTLLHERARHDIKARVEKRQIIWLSISQGRLHLVSLMDAISVRAFLRGCRNYHLPSRSSFC